MTSSISVYVFLVDIFIDVDISFSFVLSIGLGGVICSFLGDKTGVALLIDTIFCGDSCLGVCF